MDREERPDVDAVYMSVCQAMNGQGGWPLTIIMAPDCKPFFSGTYFPPYARYGRVGLEELLTAVAGQWKADRETFLDSAGQIEAHLKAQERITMSAEPGVDAVHQAFRQFLGNFDKKNGGFGGAPKFPTPHNLIFLMEYGVREKKREALAMAETTLVQMYRGGIFDHIGGGFSRYSTDETWLVPHFEKMLYDNALLVMAYVEAFGLTGRNGYKCVARRILAYVEAELTDEKGGFYCGQDADSEGVEGKYYVFTPQEICRILGPDAGTDFCSCYGITERGNFEGKSIPNLLKNEAYEAVWENHESPDLKKMYDYRITRTRLHRDDKILVSWNGWMICACAKAGAVLDDTNYLDMAARAETFIHENLVRDGRLMVRYREGDSAGEGKLDDYACYILALLELYRVTFQTDYLTRAAQWAETMVQQFFDRERGGFWMTAEDGEPLIVRTKETYDGAVPSGNSAAALGLYQLAQITGETKWQAVLNQQLHYLAGAMEGYPSGHSFALLTMMNVLYPSRELVCTVSPDESGEALSILARRLAYLAETVPGLTVVVKTVDNETELTKLAPYIGNYPLPEAGTLFYLCSGSRCMPPVKSLEELAGKLSPRDCMINGNEPCNGYNGDHHRSNKLD